MKVCLVSSTGGHLAELLKLIPAVEEHQYFVVTEFSEMSRSLAEKERVHYLHQQERSNWKFYIVVVANMFKSLKILIRENPKLIITTGAGAVFPLCLFGKLLGKKVVYIESFAKILTPSLTGKMIYKFADEFFIQWQSLSDHYPKAKYRGSLY